MCRSVSVLHFLVCLFLLLASWWIQHWTPTLFAYLAAAWIYWLVTNRLVANEIILNTVVSIFQQVTFFRANCKLLPTMCIIWYLEHEVGKAVFLVTSTRRFPSRRRNHLQHACEEIRFVNSECHRIQRSAILAIQISKRKGQVYLEQRLLIKSFTHRLLEQFIHHNGCEHLEGYRSTPFRPHRRRLCSSDRS